MPQAHARPVAILNRSSQLTDEQAHVIARAICFQANRDFAKAWGIDAKCNFVPSTSTTGWQGKANIVLLDTSDEANALGYHDITPEGLPLGKVFVKTTLADGGIPSVTASHELLELLLDPKINLTAEDTARRVFVAYEACDSVEADALGYNVEVLDEHGTMQTVRVSDFVLEDFFDSTARGRTSARFAFHTKLTAPFQLGKGGYEGVFVPGRGWTQNTNFSTLSTTPYGKGRDALALADGQSWAGAPTDRPRVGSRRERRRVLSEHGPAALTPSRA